MAQDCKYTVHSAGTFLSRSKLTTMQTIQQHNYTIGQIRAKLSATVDTVGKNGAGNFIVRLSFFYTKGKTSEQLAKLIAKALPGVNIVAHGEVWKPFKGSATVANSSHWWVEFNFMPVQQLYYRVVNFEVQPVHPDIDADKVKHIAETAATKQQAVEQLQALLPGFKVGYGGSHVWVADQQNNRQLIITAF